MKLVFMAALAVLTWFSSAPREQRTFVTRRGADTIMVERFTRSAATLTGDMMFPTGAKVHYVAYLRPDAWVDSMVVTGDVLSPPGAAGSSPAGMVDTYRFDRNIARAHLSGSRDALPDSTYAARPFPGVPQSYALFEQMIRAAHPTGNDSAHITMINFRPVRGGSRQLAITRFGDSVFISQAAGGGLQLRLAMSADGEILGGLHTTQGYVVARQ